MPASLHIIGSRGLGGAEKFYVRLVTALHEAGQEVTAVNPPRSGVAGAFYPDIRQQHLRMRNVFDPLARWQLRRLVRRTGAPIVQTYMGRATRLLRLNDDGIVHVARLGGYYDIKGYRHANAWIGNTRGICDYLVEQGLPAARVFHIGNFVDPGPDPAPGRLEALREELGIPAGHPVAVAVGRLHPNKDFGTLLEAFSRLLEPGESSLHLVIVGDGPLHRSLLEQSRRLDLGERIHWVGWQDNPQDYLRLADLFVCPSRHEPLGNVILEAWASGTPVLSTRTRGGEELIDDGVNGLLVPCENPDALAERMSAFLALPREARDELASAGRRTLEANHSREAVVNRYIELYEELAGRD